MTPRLPNVVAFSCERQQQQDRMLPRQQARGSRRTHRTMLGAKARARTELPDTETEARARQLQRLVRRLSVGVRSPQKSLADDLAIRSRRDLKRQGTELDFDFERWPKQNSV